MEGRLFGWTTSELKKLAYELAVRNNKQNKFSEEPENTSAARAAGFNRVSVGRFFELLGQTLDKHAFTPDRIYNCDETGVSVVPKTRSKVIAATGKKQVGALTSAERGTTITIEICFNAAGSYMPPMFIFPRKRMKRELLYGAPPNSWAECFETGWITAEIFLARFKKFVQFTNVSKANPVILLLDGHASHTQRLELIDEARNNGVTIICFPPHTTHKLQPGDVGFMRPLSVFYDQAVTAWLRSNPATTMSTALNAFKACGIFPYNDQIFTDADFVAAEATDIELNAEERRSADGQQPSLTPLDQNTLQLSLPQEQANDPAAGQNTLQLSLLQRQAYSPQILQPSQSQLSTSANYLPISAESSVSNLSLQPVVSNRRRSLPECQPSRKKSSETHLPTLSSLALEAVNSAKGTSKVKTCVMPDNQTVFHTSNSRSGLQESTLTATTLLDKSSCSYQVAVCEFEDRSSFHLISPKQLMPYPHMAQKRKRQVRRRGKTAIITVSPYKLELAERQRNTKCKKAKVQKSKQKKIQKNEKPKRKS
ncbi:hypothetical protein ILUMI_21341 [Ignelater luminosus]|uniref:DDE-1 domain-containing protein n=1 Tax=Ignelater luminosus TaxID=2038154 RepID=A0A8K0G1H9_IGNLU|nr:hypothetical protein ILUMI_21341 [Ignelater luminosus]